MQKDAVWRAVPSKICHRSLGRCSREQQPELSMFNALTTADTAMASSKDAGSKLKKPSSEQPTLPCCLSISGNKRPIWTMGREKKKKNSSRSLPPAHQVPYSQQNQLLPYKT